MVQSDCGLGVLQSCDIVCSSLSLVRLVPCESYPSSPRRSSVLPCFFFVGDLSSSLDLPRKHAPKAHPAQALQAAPHGAHAAHGKGGHGQFGVHGAMAKGKGSPKRLGTSFHRFGGALRSSVRFILWNVQRIQYDANRVRISSVYNACLFSDHLRRFVLVILQPTNAQEYLTPAQVCTPRSSRSACSGASHHCSPSGRFRSLLGGCLRSGGI